MAKKKVLSVIGARPQFIKAAAVSRVFSAAKGIDEVLVHTGQHFDDNMSAVFFRELSIPAPKHNLDVHGGGHGAMTGRMLEAIEAVMVAEKPDMVLIYGDTNSTLAGALAAVKLHFPVAHVEAGLRSFNRRMPEEINRVVADHVSSLLFCPTREAVKNLKAEGVEKGVYAVGDVMFDATVYARAEALARSKILEQTGVEPKNYSVATIHRAENTDDEERFRRVVEFLEEAARKCPVVFPVHPRTRGVMARMKLEPKGVKLIEPAGYFDLHRLLADATAVYTDSGGVQKEAYFHRVPCVTLRDETEWVETIECGWNRLWTVKDYKPRAEIGDYGTGRSGEEIVGTIGKWLGV